MLWHMHGIVDNHFFFDDRSDDETVSIAQEYCVVDVRGALDPGFVFNEGAFRGLAWTAFEQTMNPQVGDWVLVIDCDEVLVSNSLQLGVANPHRASLLDTVHRSSRVAIDLAIPEVFGYDESNYPLIRTDALWATIHAPRLFAYMPGGSYFHGSYGVPAVPNYAQRGPWDSADLISLMHYGYADERDQMAKYERYRGNGGHSNRHVESIISSAKTLEPWHRPFVREMMRDRDR